MKLRELFQQLQLVRQKTHASEVFLCGGTPRDRLMNHLENIADIDLTTGDKTVDKLSEELSEELSSKYNVVRKVMSDGHSSIYLGAFKMDFSSNFNVPNINSILNKIGIKNPSSMQKEMFSRDFTCNALLLSLDLKKIFDPTDRGFQDIKDKMIRTCLSPRITLTSNKNRVIRAIYLACKLDFNLDPDLIQYVKQHPNTVKISTPKSINDKLNQAFEKNPDKASSLINQMGLWDYLPINKTVYPYYMKYKGPNVK